MHALMWGSLSEMSVGAYSSVTSVPTSLLSRRVLCVLARVHLLLSHARLTLHVAAPAYLAVAGQAGEAHGRVVATSAAQTLTAGVFGTRPAACTRGVAGGSAEAGGLFEED